MIDDHCPKCGHAPLTQGGAADDHFLRRFLLWAVLTPFREAGHDLIFRWFGTSIMILGVPLGAAFFSRMPGFSLLMMAAYMYDAFDPQLTLLDGLTVADSDGRGWQNLFGDLGLLKQARGIGGFIGWIGPGLMIASLFRAAWLIHLQSARQSDNPCAEHRHDA